MGRWSASDFMKLDNKEFEFEEEPIEMTKPKGKFENFRDGETISEEVTPVFEITYMKDSGFGVYACRDKDNNDFSMKGSFPRPLQLFKPYNVRGKIESYNSKNGIEKQLVVENIELVLPTTKAGIIKYLQTLNGLKKRALDIYDVYGNESLEVLKNNPLEVANMITGIGKKSVLKWQKELMDIEDSENELMYLMDIGLKPYQANILYEKYEEEVVEKIKENPYILSKELERFGFIRADEIARNMGYELNSYHRIQEGVVYALDMSINEGHCYLPEKELIGKSAEWLDICLTIPEMNKFSKQYNSDFYYELNGGKILVNYKNMIELLNRHSNSNWKNQKLRYKIFETKEEDIKSQIKMLNLEGRVIITEDKIYLEQLYHAEMEVAHHINRIAEAEKEIEWNVEKRLEQYCQEKGIELEDRQKEAAIRFASSTGGIHVLNGSAGTGKTFTLKVIVDLIRAMYREFGERPQTLLLAPTGKASKVASKATGMECKTIHRGLKYNPKTGFEHNAGNPFDENLIIVDEGSMLDIMLAKHLLSAIKFGAKIIILGDTKQLPSVGPGNVLSDLIESNKVDTITLTVPKRQQAKSGIITNANNIIDGKMIKNQGTGDAFFIQVNTIESARSEILSLFQRIQNFKGYKFDDIQLLCPQRVGPIGTDYMNYLIQKKFNKANSSKQILNKTVFTENGERVQLYFKEGDKVIHTKNNYDMYWYEKVNNNYSLMGEEYVGITNGESGVIKEIKEENDKDGNLITKVIIKYDGMYIIYEEGTDELDHAYALTVHKYQGSQNTAIIAPIMMANYIMLDNNLFYTLYTRSEDFITIVGEERAVEHAIKTFRSKHRYTTLQEFL